MQSAQSRVLASSLLALVGVGCGPGDYASREGETAVVVSATVETTTAGGTPSADGGAPLSEEDDETAGAGWLDVEGSPLKPYCSAVQVDRDTVVTSSVCAYRASPMYFGTGPVGVGGRRVVAFTAAADDSPLVTLTLQPSAEDGRVEVKERKPGSPALDGARVHGRSYLFVARDEPSAQWTWTGTLDRGGDGLAVDLDEVAEGGANCHGDHGAGVYAEGGELVGLVVGASGIAGEPCVTRLLLAHL